MNAKKIKTAFVKMLPVLAVDRLNPIDNGIIKTVFFSLGGSGKVRCDVEVQSLNNPRDFVRVPCRHVHFKAEKEGTFVESISAEHSELIKQAFTSGAPVVVDVPGVNPVRCSYIKSMLYTRGRRGNLICSAVCADSKAVSSTIQARIGYVFTETEYAEKCAEKER